MDRLKWTEKEISFRNLIDNPAIQKPALVQIGTKLVLVGEKIKGEFIMASPCRVNGDRYNAVEQEIVLSSKHPGIWKVVSQSKSKKEGYIHRLTTIDIESIHKKDVLNERTRPRTYICTKDIEAFELLVRDHDPTVADGHRIQRRVRNIEENVEFEINDIGETEYTPSEGEITSQDYVKAPKTRHNAFLHLLLPGGSSKVHLIRNRAVRSIYCITKKDPHKRRFLLEVNEQPCDIRPIASEGSTELRYLQSTENLYNYMLTYGNDTSLHVKLLRGDPPMKAVEFDGCMIFRTVINGDRIPICDVDDLRITLVNFDLAVRVKLPTSDCTWRSLPEIRAAELQCMQLSLALLSRHESEMYVTSETEKNTTTYLQSHYNQEQRATTTTQPPTERTRRSLHDTDKLPAAVGHTTPKHKSSNEMRTLQYKSSLTEAGRIVARQPSTNHPESPRMARAMPVSHSASDKFYRDDEKRAGHASGRNTRSRPDTNEKTTISHRTSVRERDTASSAAFPTALSAPGNNYKTSRS